MDPFLQIAPWRRSIWRPPIRGTFCRTHDIAKAQQLPFALSLAVPSLSIIVVITEIGVRAKTLLSVLLFPTLAGVLLAARSTSGASS
jgi:hypothetical protein